MDSFVSSQVRMYLTKHGAKYISYRLECWWTFRLRIGIKYFHSVTTIVHAMLNQKEKILNRIIEIIFEHPFDVVFSLRLSHLRVVLLCKMCHCEWYQLTFIWNYVCAVIGKNVKLWIKSIAPFIRYH